MYDRERLVEESSRAICTMNSDCDRYSMCQLANGCRCQSWGKCELVRITGQPCVTDPQCALGLVCRETDPDTNNRCMPNTQLEDLPRFADLPETDMDTSPDIKPTYSGPLLVASISLTLVLLCLLFGFWYRYSTPPAKPCDNMEMNCPSSVLIDTNVNQPLPTYSSTGRHSPLHPPMVRPREMQRH